MTEIAIYLSINEDGRRKYVPVVSMVRENLYKLKNIIKNPLLPFLPVFKLKWLRYKLIFQKHYKYYRNRAVKVIWMKLLCTFKKGTFLSSGDLKRISRRTLIIWQQIKFQYDKNAKPIRLRLSIHGSNYWQERYLAMLESKPGDNNSHHNIETHDKKLCPILNEKWISAERLCLKKPSEFYLQGPQTVFVKIGVIRNSYPQPIMVVGRSRHSESDSLNTKYLVFPFTEKWDKQLRAVWQSPIIYLLII